MVTLAAASAALAAPGTSDPGSARVPAGAQGLDSKVHQALLGLYSLDSQLQGWRSRLATLGAAENALRHRRSALRQELGAAEASLGVAQHQLAVDLRALYERGDVDPVAVVLGAASLTKGLSRLEALSHVADQSRQIVASTTAARIHLLRSRQRLAADQRRLARSLAAAQAAERNLATAAASRLSYVSSLRAQERLQATQVRTVVAAAHAAQQKSQTLQPPAPPAPPPAGGRQLVVSATCYDLPGKTATGMPVGRGVVAVDPSVIPLGSRLQIPGYGSGVAADVGSGIRGQVIDLWFPTYAECAAWGRRTVTITIY